MRSQLKIDTVSITATVKGYDHSSYIGGICGNAITYVYLDFYNFNSSIEIENANGVFGSLIGEFNAFHGNKIYYGWVADGVKLVEGPIVKGPIGVLRVDRSRIISNIKKIA